MNKRVGIFAGTFDPVHSGHITFALEAIKKANLGLVVFMPERRPRHKNGVEHFGHRTAMIARAIRPHQKLALLELPDIRFDIKRTLPKLKKEFRGAELFLLMGGEVVTSLPAWSDVQKLAKNCELIIGLRAKQSEAEIKAVLNSLSPQPKMTFIKSARPNISSSRVRESLRLGQPALGLLKSVRRYARANWLYVWPPNK